MSNQIELSKIQKKLFTKHIAKIIEHDNIIELVFANPEANTYRINYVLHYNKIYISGDCGTAIFVLTEKADLQTIALTYYFDYFMDKLSCSSLRFADNIQDKFGVHLGFKYMLFGLQESYRQLKDKL